MGLWGALSGLIKVCFALLAHLTASSDALRSHVPSVTPATGHGTGAEASVSECESVCCEGENVLGRRVCCEGEFVL
jgi:hypothetical protein